MYGYASSTMANPGLPTWNITRTHYRREQHFMQTCCGVTHDFALCMLDLFEEKSLLDDAARETCATQRSVLLALVEHGTIICWCNVFSQRRPPRS